MKKPRVFLRMIGVLRLLFLFAVAAIKDVHMHMHTFITTGALLYVTVLEDKFARIVSRII